MSEGPAFDRGRIGDHAVDFSSFMTFRQILRNWQAILTHKQETVAVLIYLHLVTGTDPATKFGLSLFVWVTIAGTEWFT